MQLGGGGSTNILPGRGLINPAFVIKIVAATNDMQQKTGSSRKNPNDDYLSNISVGDEVDAKVKGETISGSVQRIIKNELGDVTYVMVSDEKGETRKIEATELQTRKRYRKAPEDEAAISSPAVFAESRVLLFNEFINNQEIL